MHVSSVRRLLIVVGQICLFMFGPGWSRTAVAATPNPGTDLIGKSLYLRGLWDKDQLDFDPAGHLLSKAKPGSVALSGVDLVDAKMSGKSLVLTGYRVALVAKSDPKDGLERRTIRSTKLGGKVSGELLDKMKITIQPDTAGSFDEALQAVFAEGLGELKSSVPGAWRCYAHSYFVQEVSEDAFKTVQRCTAGSAGRTSAVKRVGGGVQPPQVLHQVEPKFTVAARELKLSATVVVNLIVGRDGVPSNVEIIRAAGAGLDEVALDAVEQYRFSPAMENGVEVPVTLNIEVNFQVF